MAKRLSQQLADLSVRAKGAEQELMQPRRKHTTRSSPERNRRTRPRPKQWKRSIKRLSRPTIRPTETGAL